MKYYVKQKVFTLKDKFFIKDFDQNDIYQVQGKFMSISNKLQLLRMDGTEVLNSKKKLFRLFPFYEIFTPLGEVTATIQKKFAIKPKFDVVMGNEELKVEGSFFAHSFGIMKDGRTIASIEKKVFSFGDSYEIDIEDETQLDLLLFIVIIIDQVIHESEKKSNNL
jgi:uncharacterized protein YxjI